MSLSYRELKRRYDLDGARSTVAHLSEALSTRQLRPDDFSLRDLAEALVPEGTAWVRGLDPRQDGGVALLETGSGVDVTAFLNITGQVIQRQILDSYEHESFALAKLVRTIPTRLDGERLPGITPITGQLDPIGPGMPYPSLGFNEDYIDTPATTKRGLIVPVTREAIFFDRTHLVLSRASEVGEVLGLNKEQRLADMILGLTPSYKWRGTSYNTFASEGTDWINLLEDNALVDWTSVDAAEGLFGNMLDPATGQPILIRADQVLVMPALRHTAQRVFRAATIEYSSGATSTTAVNPLTNYRVHASAVAYRRLLGSGASESVAKGTWLLGDFARAFAYMENWPITVTQSTANSEADFTQDIVVRFKASERGAAAVLNPRYVVKCLPE
jgi:hypothetical protein